MITSTRIPVAETIIDEMTTHEIEIECWDDDNCVVHDGLLSDGTYKFRAEITKENAIKMARTILVAYNAL